MSITVKNIKGSSNRNRPSGYDSWLDFYNRKKGETNLCANLDCSNNAEVGGHVRLVDNENQKDHIVPLCSSCNNVNNEDEFEVVESWLLQVHE